MNHGIATWGFTGCADLGWVESTQAPAAAEEVAGYENWLTRLSTQMQMVIAVLLILLGSQAALWGECGKLGSHITESRSQITDLQARTGRIEEQIAKMAEQNGQILVQPSRMTGTAH